MDEKILGTRPKRYMTEGDEIDNSKSKGSDLSKGRPTDVKDVNYVYLRNGNQWNTDGMNNENTARVP